MKDHSTITLLSHALDINIQHAQKIWQDLQRHKKMPPYDVYLQDIEWPDLYSSLIMAPDVYPMYEDPEQWFIQLGKAFYQRNMAPVYRWFATFDLSTLYTLYCQHHTQRYERSTFYLAIFHYLNEHGFDLSNKIAGFEYDTLRLLINKTHSLQNHNHHAIEDAIHRTLFTPSNNYRTLEFNVFFKNRHFYQQPSLYAPALIKMLSHYKLKTKMEFLGQMVQKMEHTLWLHVAEKILPDTFHNFDALPHFFTNTTLQGKGLWPLIYHRASKNLRKNTYGKTIFSLCSPDEQQTFQEFLHLCQISSIRWSDYWCTNHGYTLNENIELFFE